MRGRTPNRCDYTMDRARRELANGVHFGVVAARLGASEADLAVALDLTAEETLEVLTEHEALAAFLERGAGR
jgi:hypothetical protein